MSPLSILNRLEPFLSQSDASVNFGGPWNALDGQFQICPILDFLTFGQISLFMNFFQITLKTKLKGLEAKINQACKLPENGVKQTGMYIGEFTNTT